MTDQEKLIEIKKRISDLGTMAAGVADVQQSLSPVQEQFVSVLWNRLVTIREIILQGKLPKYHPGYPESLE